MLDLEHSSALTFLGGTLGRMCAERSQTARHIVDQIKSQGLFDRIRKQCLEDVDIYMDYQILQKKVNSFVSSFLQSQSWDPSVEKLKLREQLRTKLQRTKMLSCGVDRLVCQALRAKMPKGFRNQVQNIVCDYFSLTPDSLMINNNVNQGCDDVRLSAFSELQGGPCVTETFDRNYGCPAVNAVAIPATPAVQPPFPYTYPTVPVQHPVIQPSVPCPMNAYSTSITVQAIQVVGSHVISPKPQCDSSQIRVQPVEVTVEESVQCDDPMDIESLNSNSPVDQNTVSPSCRNLECFEEREISKVNESISEKSSHYPPNQTAWHNANLMLDDVSEDEEKYTNSKSLSSFENRIKYSDHCSSSRSPHAGPHSYDRNSPLQNDVHSFHDLAHSNSSSTYNDRKHQKFTRSTLEYNPEILSDFTKSNLTKSLTRDKNYYHTKYSRSSTSPLSSNSNFYESTHIDRDDWRPRTVEMSSQKEMNSCTLTNRPRTAFLKKHLPHSPTTQSAHHLSDTRRHSHCTRSPNVSIDRRMKSEYSSSNLVSSRFRASPDSGQTKTRSRRSLPTVASSCEWFRNESHSPEEHSSRSSSMFSHSNNSLSSTSERLTPDPTGNSQYAHSRPHNKAHETDTVNSYSLDFTLDRLTRKREIEARLKEIESTERKLLNKQKMLNYGKEARPPTNSDDIEHGSDYKRFSKKYVK
ncbi:unnamed protein product [Heterobilharzia americana]|nr:unnamed protein product [Heterobilharzia americana]